MIFSQAFTDMKIRSKIYLGFGALIVIAGGIAGVSEVQLNTVHGDVRRLNVLSESMQQALKVNTAVETMRRAQIRYRFDSDKAQLTAFAAARDEALALLDTAAKAALSEERRQTYMRGGTEIRLIDTAMKETVEALDLSASQRQSLFRTGDALTVATTRVLEAAEAGHDAAQLDVAERMERALLTVRVANWRYLATHDAAGIATFSASVEKAGTAIAVMEKAGNEGTGKLLPAVRTALAAYVADFTAITAALAKVAEVSTQKLLPQIGALQTEMTGVVTSLTHDFEATREELDATLSSTSLMQEVIAGVAVAFGLFFAWLIGGGISRSVIGLAAAMRKLAAGEHNITVPATERRDEIGEMGKTVLVFQQNAIEGQRLAGLQAAEQTAKDARTHRLDDLVKIFENRVGQMVGLVASSATELQATANSMSGTATTTTTQVTTVAAAAEQASMNVQTVAAAAEELAASIAEISRQVQQSATVSGKAVLEAERTNTTVQALADGAQRIGDVVSLISSIAGQTNLLALNATIEAARAGDAGKGFAVVASEVKNLATQTAKATEEIAQQIGQIQASTRNAVTAIQTISATIGEVGQIAAAIAAAVEEQGAATQEIARNVQQAAIGTREVTSNISGVSQGAVETGAAASELLEAAGELSRQAEHLSGEVSQFISGVKAA